MDKSEIRIRNNRRKRTYQLRRNIIIAIFSFLIILFASAKFKISSKAQMEESIVFYKYYTNIEIRPGDTLWGIAEKYFCKEKYENYNQYIEELMRINRLYNEKIIAGTYLIVPYYSLEFKE